MPPRELFAFVALVAVSCQGAPALDATDDMSPDPMTYEPGAVRTVCDGCFSGTCSWQFSECAADPACANWLTCAGNCEADGITSPWSLECVLSCEQPNTQASQSLQQELLQCVRTAEGCCGSPINGGAAGSNETAVDGGYGPAPDGNDGTGGNAGGAGYDAQCFGETCEACLGSIKGNVDDCTGGDVECVEAIAACRHELEDPVAVGPCWHIASMRDCTRPIASGARECGFELPEESVTLTANTMRCAAKYCPACAPGDNQACLSCQLSSCPDEMRAMWQDLAAQQLFWCMDLCARSNASSECRAACWTEHGGGSMVVEALGLCTMESCAEVCGL